MEEFMMGRLLDRASGIAAALYLVSLLGVVIFKPERIRSPYLFRLAYMLLAVALVLPALIDSLLQMALFDDGRAYGRSMGGLGFMFVSPLFHMIGHVLFGVSILCGFGSLHLHGGSKNSADRIIPPADQ
jgi:hypothetical protein